MADAQPSSSTHACEQEWDNRNASTARTSSSTSLAVPDERCKAVSGTNTIEACTVNLKSRDQSPHEQATVKLIDLAAREANAKWHGS